MIIPSLSEILVEPIVGGGTGVGLGGRVGEGGDAVVASGLVVTEGVRVGTGIGVAVAVCGAGDGVAIGMDVAGAKPQSCPFHRRTETPTMTRIRSIIHVRRFCRAAAAIFRCASSIRLPACHPLRS
jgi:hypothetical protein